MGLLDGGGFELNPQTMGLLGAASGLMQAAGPSRMPVSMFSALGQGLQGGLQGYGQGVQLQAQAQRQKLLEQQTQLAMIKAKQEMDLDNFIAQRLGMGGGAPSPASAPQMPMGGGGMPPAPMASGRPAIEQRSLMPTDVGGEMGGADQAAGGAAGLPPGAPDLQSLLRAAPKVAQAAPQVPAQGGAFPFSLNDVTALKLRGRDISKEYELANQGFKREGGAQYVMPDGRVVYVPKLENGQVLAADGTVTNAPGAVNANAEYKGAETLAQERAKAGFNTAMIPTRDGGSVPAFQVFGGGVPGAGGFGAGAPGAPAGGPLGGQTPGNKVYDEGVAKAANDHYTTLQAAGASADSRIAKLNQLDKLLENHDGGKLSQTGLDIASAANSFGIKLDKNLPNKEAANALANEMALQLRNPAGGAGMPGAMSDSDRNFLASMTPGIANSAAGRKTMVQMQVALETRNKDVAGLARQWQQRFGRIDAPDAQGRTFQDQLQRWSSERPLFQSAQQ